MLFRSLAGCTANSAPGAQPTSPAGTTATATVTNTGPAPAPTFTPAPARYLASLLPGAAARKGEKDKLCPYIRTGLNQDPTSKANLADISGERIYRTTVITTSDPVGCRFWNNIGGDPVAEITVRLFATAADAHNAMVLTAEAGAEASGKPGAAGGLDAVVFRTKFLQAHAGQDWAAVFAKGTMLVTVRMAVTDQAVSVLGLADIVAKKITPPATGH